MLLHRMYIKLHNVRKIAPYTPNSIPHEKRVSQGTDCNTLQHTATHCNPLQSTATRGIARQHTATHCNTRQHVATYCTALQRTAIHCNILQRTATHCNTFNTLHKKQVEERSVHSSRHALI